MGLAASQARLLTITSRLSSVEMRQQRIAMDKMRLASDTDKISEKYTNAINNKTLSISNGSEEVPMTYSALASHGYSVMRASDGVIASSASSSSTGVANASSASNAKNTTTINSNSTTTVNPEIQKWVGQPAPTQPTPPTTRLSDVLATKPTTQITAVDYSTETTNAVNSMLIIADTALNPKEHGLTGMNIIAAGLVNLVKLEEEGYPKLIETLQNAQQKAQKNGDNETAQKYAELVKKAQASYNACKSQTHFKGDQLETHLSNRIYELNNIKNEISSIQTSVNNNAANKNQTAQAEYDKRVAVAQAAENEYQQALSQYSIDYANWVTANSSSNSSEGASKAGQTTGANRGSTTTDNSGSTGSTGTAGATGASVAASQELAEQLKNTQFLIQGLLSGYLALVKDGQQVSLSSATDIIESYDKSDDAAAEAEYNAETNKINRKEKMLDMQAKRLDTEYSALTNEYNSIKTIISNHTQKDFSYFS